MRVTRSLLRGLLLVLLSLASLSTPLAAQSGSAHSPPGPPAVGQAEDCPYLLCAVRVRGDRLVRGWVGEPVGRLGLLGGDPEILLRGPEPAAEDARLYQRLQRRSTASWVLAAPLLGLGLVAAESGPSQFNDGQIPVFSAAWVGGLYLLNRGMVLHRQSRHALRGSIEAYNEPFTPAEVPRLPQPPIAPTRDPSAWLILGGGGLGALAGGVNGQEGLYWGTLAGAGVGAILSALLVRW